MPKLFEANQNTWIETDFFSACFYVDFITKFDNFNIFYFHLFATQKKLTSENVSDHEN